MPDSPTGPDAGRAVPRDPVNVRCDEVGGIRYVRVDPVHTGHTNRTARLAFRVVGPACDIELVEVKAYSNGTVPYQKVLNPRALDADVRYDVFGGTETTVLYELWFRGPDGDLCQAFGGEPESLPPPCGFGGGPSEKAPPQPPPKVDFP